MPRILVVQPHMVGYGGSSRFVAESARALRPLGYETIVLTQEYDENLFGAATQGLEVVTIGGPLPDKVSHWAQLPRLLARMGRAVSAVQPDIIMPQVFPSNWWGFHLKKAFPTVPCAWMCHEPSAFVHNRQFILGLKPVMRTIATIASPAARLIDVQLARRADTIIANSEYTREAVRRVYDRDAAVARPGVDLDKFRPGSQKGPDLLAVGRWTRFKRLDVLLRAFASVADETELRGRTLRIAGGGDELDRAQRLAHVLGVASRVEFLGALSDRDLIAEYQHAALVVFPSSGEPFGLVPIEAMACGTAVLASSTGGPGEVILTGQNGALFRGTSPVDLAMALCEVLSDAQRLVTMGVTARLMAMERHSWASCAQSLDDAIQPLLAGPQSRLADA